MKNKLNWYRVKGIGCIPPYTIFTGSHRGKTEWGKGYAVAPEYIDAARKEQRIMSHLCFADEVNFFYKNPITGIRLPAMQPDAMYCSALIDGEWVPVDKLGEVLSRRFPVDCTTA